MNTSTSAPAQKVIAGGVAGAIVTILIWFAGTFAHVDIPAEVAASLVVVLSFLVSYITPPAAKDTPVPKGN